MSSPITSVLFLSFQPIDIPGVFSAQQEYYPYVYLKLDLDYIDITKK